MANHDKHPVATNDRATKPGEPDRNGPEAAKEEEKLTGSHVRVVNQHTAALGLPPHKGASKQLNPGENNVSAEHWAAVKDHATVANWVKSGLIHEGSIADTVKPEGPSAVDSLDAMGPSSAAKMIAQTDDKAQLAKWQQNEKRPVIQEAISRRLEALGTGK